MDTSHNSSLTWGRVFAPIRCKTHNQAQKGQRQGENAVIKANTHICTHKTQTRTTHRHTKPHTCIRTCTKQVPAAGSVRLRDEGDDDRVLYSRIEPNGQTEHLAQRKVDNRSSTRSTLTAVFTRKQNRRGRYAQDTQDK